ncbi:MAG: hypothetical protein KGJ30_01585, partial [Burkholderiales bacterium]|nr:hypothetical protein [Burkholderiales bacterium]
AGDAVGARGHLDRAQAICRAGGDRRGEARVTAGIGRLDLAAGQLEAARAGLAQAVRAFRAYEMREELIAGLEALSALHASAGRPELALRLLAACGAARGRLALAQPAADARRLAGQLEALRRELAAAAFEQAWHAGAAMEIDEAIDEATRR